MTPIRHAVRMNRTATIFKLLTVIAQEVNLGSGSRTQGRRLDHLTTEAIGSLTDSV